MIEHEVFRRSDLLVQNIVEIIDRPMCDGSARIAVSANLCQMSIEHCCALRALSESRMFASGFVILRSQFEAVVRAIWVLYCATDEQVQRLASPLNDASEQSAKNLPSVHDMLEALGKVPAAKVPFDALSEFKSYSWKALNSFTHAGIHPLQRMIDGYPLVLIVQNVRVSNGLAMIAAMQVCVLTGIPNLQRELLPLNGRFHDCLPDHRSSP
ncbi:hypothetical protein [Lysobacter sp. Root690]|uniref:DUF6988 family protein n=1 Tax=Lysobacter sp. Root690 TaxID=1736588 RepID=UPI0006F61CB4|nr:hypothetical protein [Lysobacter sp. Root690]KRB08065.1 hypothetical protein ASD86_09740 [Lysobacter sp. Root690]